MPVQALFGLNVAFSFLAWGTVAARYIWPMLRDRSRVEALEPLLVLNAFRFLGLSFLIPGVASPGLPATFAVDAAYGDLIAAVLALLSLVALRSKFGIPLVWIFNIWGTADMLNAFYRASSSGLTPGQFGAAYFIPTAIVPLLLITHCLIFWLLLRSPSRASVSRSRPLSASG
jgi:hypothetical protein